MLPHFEIAKGLTLVSAVSLSAAGLTVPAALIYLAMVALIWKSGGGIAPARPILPA